MHQPWIHLHTWGHQAEGAAGQELTVVPLYIVPAPNVNVMLLAPVPLGGLHEKGPLSNALCSSPVRLRGHTKCVLLGQFTRKACSTALHCMDLQVPSVGPLLLGVHNINVAHALSSEQGFPGESTHQSVMLLADAAAVVRQALLPDIPAEQQKNVPPTLWVAKQWRCRHHVPWVLQTGDDDVLHDTIFAIGTLFEQTG